MQLRSPTARPLSVALLSGHTLLVGPEPRDIPRRFYQAAIARGCLSAEQYAELEGERAAPPPELDPHNLTEQEKAVMAIIDQMLAADPATTAEAFTRDGKPDVNALTQSAGFRVSAESRDKLWAIKSAELEGADDDATGDDKPDETFID